MAKRYKISIQDTQIVTASNEDEAIQMVQETLSLSNLNYDVEEVDDDNVKISDDKSKCSMTKQNKTECGKCGKMQDSPPEDMSYESITNLLLCDDCHTELRYAIADQLDLEVWELNI